jgi:hypothetical protein
MASLSFELRGGFVSMTLGFVALPGVALQQSDLDSLDNSERRIARRKAAGTSAVIISPAVSVPISCLVRDYSPTGARLEIVVTPENLLGGRVKLPAHFKLQMRLDRMEMDCAIMWRRGAFVGVKFLATPRVVGKSGR